MPAFLQRFSTRLMLGVVIAFLPLTAVLAVALVTKASSALEKQAEAGLGTAARTAAARVEDELAARRTNLQVLSGELSRGGDAREVLRDLDRLFESLQALDADGRIVAGTGSPLLAPGDAAFDEALAARSGFVQPARRDGTIRTIMSEPVRGRDLVLAADLDESVFVTLLEQARVGGSADANLRMPGGALLWSTLLGRAGSPADMASRGALLDRAVPEAPRRAFMGDSGAVRYRDDRDVDVIGGYAPVREVGWASVSKADRDDAFAAVDDQRDLALLIGGLGVLIVLAFAAVFARRTTQPVRELAAAAQRVAGGDLRVRVTPRGATELRAVATSFNTMVDSLTGLAIELREASRELATASNDLLSASQELATTTNQQSSAAQETSSTMEELAQTSSAIADTAGVVAERTDETRGVLERADAELRSSSERLVDLAARSTEVGRILVLINDIAEKTNLLALNAAIEAARAGEAGAGFAVVAEEVRLLAERSKAEAAKIDEIVRRTQDDVNASVMALEAGSKEMARGLGAVRSVADSTSEVRLSTDQQRIATSQVVDTMLSVSSAVHQTAETAHSLTRSATDIQGLASRLDAAVHAFRTGRDGDAVTADGDAPPAPADASGNGAPLDRVPAPR